MKVLVSGMVSRMVAGGLALGALAGAALADEPKKDWTLTGSVAATTDYVFRGFSQSGGHAAAQGSVDFTYKMFYAGVFLSSIDFSNTPGISSVAHAEMDLYAGVKFPIGKIDVDLGAIYYTYPRARENLILNGFRELDYLELKASASYKPLSALTLTGTVFYSPEYTNKTGSVWTFEGGYAYEWHKIGSITPTTSSTIGYQIGDSSAYKALVGNGEGSYLYWNSGVTLGFGDNFSLDFRYWDTNVSNKGNFCGGNAFQCDERYVATAKVTF